MASSLSVYFSLSCSPLVSRVHTRVNVLGINILRYMEYAFDLFGLLGRPILYSGVRCLLIANGLC